MILGTGGNGGDGLLAGLIDAARELAVGGVSPARGSRFITGAGIAFRLTGPVTQVVAVTPGDRHEQGEAGERAVPPPVPAAPVLFMGAAIGGIGCKTIGQGGVRGRVSVNPTPQGLSRPGKAVRGPTTRSGLRTGL